jgi:hypothetical protein
MYPGVADIEKISKGFYQEFLLNIFAMDVAS